MNKHNKRSLISIITAFYNNEDSILFAIKSVIDQVITNKISIEYIIVNDCSTDKSYNIVKNFINTNNKNKFIECKLFTTPENLGCGGARKFGISKANGDYFMFLDGDDYYIDNTFVSRAYKDITSDRADIVEYGIIENSVNGNKRNIVVDKKYIFTDQDNIMNVMFHYGQIKFYAWSKIYTKDIINSHEYSDVRTYEDIRTIPYWVSNAKKIVIIPTCEINYRANKNSIIRNNELDTRIGTVKALLELMKNLPEKYAWIIYERAMIDLEIVLNKHTSEDPGFNELSKYNTEMIKILFPNDYHKLTYNIDE